MIALAIRRALPLVATWGVIVTGVFARDDNHPLSLPRRLTAPHAPRDNHPLGDVPVRIAVPPVPPAVTLPPELAPLWPLGLPRIPGLTMFRPTRYSHKSGGRWYRLDQDDGQGVNPNHVFPWVTPGGLHAVPAPAWRSTHAASIPGPVHVWEAGGATEWAFPDGTTFVDVLTAADGRLFELRRAVNTAGKWKHEAVYRDLDAAPRGFTGAGRSCSSCHDKAGHREPGTTIPIRGKDHVLSWAPLVDDGNGKLTWRTDVEFVHGPPAWAAPPAKTPAVQTLVRPTPPVATMFVMARAARPTNC